jgi:3-oxoacyl-[acyl-carrier protein] reductase
MGNRLAGKVAIVTGASRGIGAAVVRGLCAEGASVLVAHHHDAEMASLAADLATEMTGQGYRALAHAADIADPGEVREMVAVTTDLFGAPHVLVANAAAFHRGPWSDIDVDEWDRVFEVNVRGTFLCCREVLPAMCARGSGSIITVSSVTARAGLTGMLPYVASKGAIVAMTRALAREVGPSGVRVNAVAPGAIRTELELEVDGHEAEGDRMAATFQSIPRRVVADDLVGTFVYLASDESSAVTGQTLAVDGGWVHR